MINLSTSVNEHAKSLGFLIKIYFYFKIIILRVFLKHQQETYLKKVSKYFQRIIGIHTFVIMIGISRETYTKNNCKTNQALWNEKTILVQTNFSVLKLGEWT